MGKDQLTMLALSLFLVMLTTFQAGVKPKKFLVEMYDDDDESTNAPEVLFKETVGDITFKTAKAKLVRDWRSDDYSVCQRPPDEEFAKQFEEGNCYDDRTCKFMKNGEVLQSGGGDPCKVLFCRSKSVMEFDNGCGYCFLPWSEQVWGATEKESFREKPKDPSNPCTRYSCVKVDGGKSLAKLTVDPKGCEKPSSNDLCSSPCEDDTEKQYLEKNQNSKTWECWISDYSCFYNCTCTRRTGGRPSLRAKRPSYGTGHCNTDKKDKCFKGWPGLVDYNR